MIDLYTWPTPNGQKVSIMLEEVGLPYNVIPVDIGKGDQFDPDYLKISPNNKMPAIVDHDGPDGQDYPMFESGAILMYLAEKTGMFMPRDMAGKYRVVQWLMFQMGGVGPMLGQAHHFRQYAPEKIEYAINRYTKEAGRLYNVVNTRLGEAEYLAGDLSIADFATYPWLALHERHGVNMDELPHVRRWLDALKERPKLRAGFGVLSEKRRQGPMDDETKKMLFGDEQYRRHG